LGPIQRSGNRFKSGAKRAAKFANNINESGWETLAQRRLIARICSLFKAYTGGRAWKAIENRFLKPCYLSRAIIIGKLGLENNEQMLVNIPSKIGTIKAGTNYMQAY